MNALSPRRRCWLRSARSSTAVLSAMRGGASLRVSARSPSNWLTDPTWWSDGRSPFRGSRLRAIQHGPPAGGDCLAWLDGCRVRSDGWSEPCLPLQRSSSLVNERSHGDQDRHHAGNTRAAGSTGHAVTNSPDRRSLDGRWRAPSDDPTPPQPRPPPRRNPQARARRPNVRRRGRHISSDPLPCGERTLREPAHAHRDCPSSGSDSSR
jgi:hypothetical protein